MKLMRILAALCVYAALGASCSSGGGQVVPPPPPPVERPAFDARRAFADLEAQCNFGPRAPGTAAHDRCAQFLQQALIDTGARVVTQEFSSATGLSSTVYDFVNILGIYAEGSGGEPLLLGAHWDSRAIAERDPDPSLRDRPILGANDGASGAAVLLELARAFARPAPPRPVIIGFFDAEDQGGTHNAGLPHEGWILGSSHLAANWPATVPWPTQMILLDLVGGDSEHNPRVGTPPMSDDVFRLPMEGTSLEQAPDLVDAIWTIAERLGHGAFVRQTGAGVVDDHVPFLEAGVEAIDIIEFVPPEWHTQDDTPEHCSADSLLQVGDTLLEFIYGD